MIKPIDTTKAGALVGIFYLLAARDRAAASAVARADVLRVAVLTRRVFLAAVTLFFVVTRRLGAGLGFTTGAGGATMSSKGFLFRFNFMWMCSSLNAVSKNPYLT